MKEIQELQVSKNLNEMRIQLTSQRGDVTEPEEAKKLVSDGEHNKLHECLELPVLADFQACVEMTNYGMNVLGK